MNCDLDPFRKKNLVMKVKSFIRYSVNIQGFCENKLKGQVFQSQVQSNSLMVLIGMIGLTAMNKGSKVVGAALSLTFRSCTFISPQLSTMCIWFLMISTLGR